jgi:hypothetical protein
MKKNHTNKTLKESESLSFFKQLINAGSQTEKHRHHPHFIFIPFVILVLSSPFHGWRKSLYPENRTSEFLVDETNEGRKEGNSWKRERISTREVLSISENSKSLSEK